MSVMTAAAVKPPFADASPAQIRAVLLDEERPEFDRQFRWALAAASESFSLDELRTTLQSWRRIAWMTHTDPEAHRRMLSAAARTLTTGERPAGSVSWDQVRAELGL